MRIDVSDLLTDPDFVDTTLVCIRQSQTVGLDGLAVDAQTSVPFSGVVTSDSGAKLMRTPGGERIQDNMTIHTRFVLTDGASGFSADIVIWNGQRYTVASVNDYSTYGRGFISASCDLIPLSG